jgi:hypothetical protein
LCHSSQSTTNMTEFQFLPCGKWFSKIFLLGEKSPKSPKSGITHTVTSNGGHPLHHHQIQTRMHSGRLFNSLFNRRTTTLQTLTVAASLCIVVLPPVALHAIYHHPSGQSTVRFDSLCSGPQSRTHIYKKKHDQKIFFYARESLKQ